MSKQYSQSGYGLLPPLAVGSCLAILVWSASLTIDSKLPISYLLSSAHAQQVHSFDYSADDIDYRNNRLPKPYIPAGSGLNFKYPTLQSDIPQVEVEETPSVDIWSEIRDSFQLESFESDLVKRHEKRYTRNPKHFERILERAKEYLPYIFEQTQRYNMPSEVVLLPLIESGYNPRIYSTRGAAGLWQFMPATGRNYGLKQDWWYEGRRDITYSTQAALKHLRDLNEMFNGDWPLTFAAYNVGHNGMIRAINANKRRNKPTDLKSLKLNSETRNFYPKLIAVKNIIQNPNDYGVKLPEVTTKSPFEIVEFDFQIDLAVLSEAIQIDSVQLALLNPGLRRYATPPDGPFRILVPAEKLSQTVDWKRDLRPSEAIVARSEHRVSAGDTLSEIAEFYGVSIASIKVINAKSSNLIKIGEILRIPSHRGASEGLSGLQGVEIVHQVVANDSLSEIAQAYNVKLSELRAINGLSAKSDLIRIGQQLRIPDSSRSISNKPTVAASSQDLRSRVQHSVRSGESLWTIARRYGVRVIDIVNWNKISRSAHIYPGQKLVIYIH